MYELLFKCSALGWDSGIGLAKQVAGRYGVWGISHHPTQLILLLDLHSTAVVHVNLKGVRDIPKIDFVVSVGSQ